MNTALKLIPLLAAGALAACGSDEGTTVSIKADNGSVVAGADKDGRVSIKAPGFEGSIKLPKFQMDAGDFEIDGVKLYPGSTIANFNVDGSAGADKVKVEFDAPAAADRVQGWFREQMQSAGFSVELKDGVLQGKTGEGSPFTLKIAPGTDAKSKGTLTVQGT